MSIKMKSVLFAMLVMAATAVTAQAQQGYTTRIYPTPGQYMLLIEGVASHDGFTVTRVFANSPTRSMTQLGRPNVIGVLEAGDVITHVDGRRIVSDQGLRNALNRSGGLTVLTVRDVNTGFSVQWVVRPAKVSVMRAEE